MVDDKNNGFPVFFQLHETPEKSNVLVTEILNLATTFGLSDIVRFVAVQYADTDNSVAVLFSVNINPYQSNIKKNSQVSNFLQYIFANKQGKRPVYVEPVNLTNITSGREGK